MNLVCFSHLRWHFVYQRPQHLLSRFSEKFNVYYVEEFVFSDEEDGYDAEITTEGIVIIQPHLQHTISKKISIHSRMKLLLNQLLLHESINEYIFWYYTPMAISYTRHFKPSFIIYDCMDELSAFKFAPAEIKALETELIRSADLVFTGGNSLYEVKKDQHPNVYAFPSSIDKDHFSKARSIEGDPSDQENIPHPRLGFFGVIDERFDIDLIHQVAAVKPDWHFVIIGPVVKINPDKLPTNKNIHYLGSKQYNELPEYIATWDIALIPFALNESTRFISPTKTPEYLAAGKPVISTPIADVVEPYERLDLVHIIQGPAQLIEKATYELESKDKRKWLASVDEYLSDISWDDTWHRMNTLITDVLHSKQNTVTQKQENYI